MITEIERFEAIADNGKRYTVVHLQHWTEFRPLSGKAQQLPGSTEWKTACGIDLEENEDGTFKMIQIDGILRRI
jgi:hypothetical protein